MQCNFEYLVGTARMFSGTSGTFSNVYVDCDGTIVPFNPEGALLDKKGKRMLFSCSVMNQAQDFYHLNQVFNLMTMRRKNYKVFVSFNNMVFSLHETYIFKNGDIIFFTEPISA